MSLLSRKENKTFLIKDLVKKLIPELESLKSHLHRAHMQFREFKQKRLEAAKSNVVTIHIDWSENSKIRQAQEEKSAYYRQDKISIHPMHIWT